jgi:hypothetical protein
MQKVSFTSALKRFFPDLEEQRIKGSTVAEVLDSLERDYPGMTDHGGRTTDHGDHGPRRTDHGGGRTTDHGGRTTDHGGRTTEDGPRRTDHGGRRTRKQGSLPGDAGYGDLCR